MRCRGGGGETEETLIKLDSQFCKEVYVPVKEGSNQQEREICIPVCVAWEGVCDSETSKSTVGKFIPRESSFIFSVCHPMVSKGILVESLLFLAYYLGFLVAFSRVAALFQ